MGNSEMKIAATALTVIVASAGGYMDKDRRRNPLSPSGYWVCQQI
jgi:hypothetical protein